jgi:FkbM family methyltransferase
MTQSFLKKLAVKFPYLAGIYRALRYGPYIIEPPKNSKLGFQFTGSDSVISGDYEIEESALVRKLLPNVDRVINVGANIGYYVCMALYAGKPAVAFEPIPLNVQLLLKNIHSNCFEVDVEIFPIALCEKPGVLEIYGGGTGASLIKGWANTPDDFSCLAPTSTLDLVLGGRFVNEQLLIIVDIEGAEKRMLDAANVFLNMNPKPFWLIEINGTVNQPMGVKMNPYFLENFCLYVRVIYTYLPKIII